MTTHGMEYSPADPETGSGFYLDLNISLPLNPANTTPSLPRTPNGSYDNTPLIITALKSTAILFVIIAAIFGNILVIISVFKFRNLRIISNVFIMSLAFADLLVAVLVMPFSASQEIVGHWVFSVLACDIFNANDVLFSNASLLHLCCISIDRYVAITDPFHYGTRMTRCKVALMLSCAWGASALISHIPVHTGLYTTERIRNTTSVYEGVCVFEVNKIYAIISSTISFWVPTLIMLGAYFVIFRVAHQQERRMLEQRRASCVQMINGTDRIRLTRDHKATKTLGVIMGCFLLCWLPFFLWYVITTICGDDLCPTPPDVISMLFWIGYFNSALNPMIYAYFNRDFRNAFKTLLRFRQIRQKCCGCCNHSNHNMRQTRMNSVVYNDMQMYDRNGNVEHIQ